MDGIYDLVWNASLSLSTDWPSDSLARSLTSRQVVAHTVTSRRSLNGHDWDEEGIKELAMSLDSFYNGSVGRVTHSQLSLSLVLLPLFLAIVYCDSQNWMSEEPFSLSLHI